MANERTPQQIIGDDAFNQLTFEGYVVTRPAAPVEGLEPIAWPINLVNMPDTDDADARILGFRIRAGDEAFGEYGLSEALQWLKKACMDSVYGSQAEAIIAAERAAIPILKGTAFKSGDGWKDTTREGEICFVWNKMHPAPYAPGQYPRVGKEHWSASTENFKFEPATPDEVVILFSALETQLAAARKALEFYGDVHKYPAPLTGGMGALWSDCGAIARAALEDLP